MTFRLIPKEERFYDDFVALARRSGGRLAARRNARAGTATLGQADEIKEVEHKCDFLTHEIIERLQPHVRHAARSGGHPRPGPIARRRHGCHRRDRRNCPALPDQSGPYGCAGADADHHGATADQVVKALKALERRKGVAEPAVEINRLENEADRVHRIAVRRLFEEERDPIQIMKWKEILDFLEAATDRCEDVANVLEGVVVKHA